MIEKPTNRYAPSLVSTPIPTGDGKTCLITGLEMFTRTAILLAMGGITQTMFSVGGAR